MQESLIKYATDICNIDRPLTADEINKVELAEMSNNWADDQKRTELDNYESIYDAQMEVRT
jgi:hypothetical protein